MITVEEYSKEEFDFLLSVELILRVTSNIVKTFPRVEVLGNRAVYDFNILNAGDPMIRHQDTDFCDKER